MADIRKQVVVVGLGRFGSSVARALYNLGHDVLAMDVDEDKVQSMMGQVTHPISGDATNETVLKELGIPDYDAAVVAVGSDIVTSVMTCVLFKTMEVPFMVARAKNEKITGAGVRPATTTGHHLGQGPTAGEIVDTGSHEEVAIDHRGPRHRLAVIVAPLGPAEAILPGQLAMIRIICGNVVHLLPRRNQDQLLALVG